MFFFKLCMLRIRTEILNNLFKSVALIKLILWITRKVPRKIPFFITILSKPISAASHFSSILFSRLIASFGNAPKRSLSSYSKRLSSVAFLTSASFDITTIALLYYLHNHPEASVLNQYQYSHP